MQRQSKNSDSGAITVFLSIILLGMIILAGILVDGARMRIGETQVKRALESALSSTLAGYDYPTKERYGLFILDENDPAMLAESVSYYVGSNLMTELGETEKKKSRGDRVYGYLKGLVLGDGGFKDVNFLDLYDYKIEDVTVMPIFNLSENEVTRSQIVSYMKYRAPKSLSEDFIEKIKGVKESAKMTEVYRRKIEADRLISRLEKLRSELKDTIDTEINTFNDDALMYKEGNNKANAMTYYVNTVMDCRALSKYKKGIEESSASDDGVLRGAVNMKYAAVRSRRGTALSDTQRYFNRYKAYNEEALGIIQEIQQLGGEIAPKIKELEDYYNSSFSANDLNQGFAVQMKEDIQKLKIAVMKDDKGAAALVDAIKSNSALMDSAVKNIRNLDDTAEGEAWGVPYRDYAQENVLDYLDFNYDNDRLFTDEASSQFITLYQRDQREWLDKLKGVHSGYNNQIRYDYRKPSGSGSDPRKTAEGSAKEAMTGKDVPEGKKLTAQMVSQLPSYFTKGKYPNKVFTEDVSGADKDYKEAYDTAVVGNMAQSIRLTDENSKNASFAEKSFDFMAQMGKKLGTMLEEEALGARDEIYVNEYIMGTFKNAVPYLDAKGQPKPDFNLREISKKSEKAFFDNCEVEYILNGLSSEKANLLATKGQILIIRFAVNTLDVYTDKQKNTEALGIATAIAGWTGFGVPVVHTLVMCSMGMEAALADISDIMAGKSVPFYKKTPKVQLTYHDYLKLLLLFENSDIKMNRVQDLIQLNMQQSDPGYRVADFHGYLRAEVTVSMKYLFMTQPFVSKEIRKADKDRYQMKVVLYKGY